MPTLNSIFSLNFFITNTNYLGGENMVKIIDICNRCQQEKPNCKNCIDEMAKAIWNSNIGELYGISVQTKLDYVLEIFKREHTANK